MQAPEAIGLGLVGIPQSAQVVVLPEVLGSRIAGMLVSGAVGSLVGEGIKTGSLATTVPVIGGVGVAPGSPTRQLAINCTAITQASMLLPAKNS